MIRPFFLPFCSVNCSVDPVDPVVHSASARLRSIRQFQSSQSLEFNTLYLSKVSWSAIERWTKHGDLKKNKWWVKRWFNQQLWLTHEQWGFIVVYDSSVGLEQFRTNLTIGFMVDCGRYIELVGWMWTNVKIGGTSLKILFLLTENSGLPNIELRKCHFQ